MSLAHPVIWRAGRRGAGAALAFALALARPASAACGVAAGTAKVAEVTERLEIRLEDGRLVRLAGLDVPDSARGAAETAANARAFLAGRLAGREAALVAFAAKPDRWGRVPADLEPFRTAPAARRRPPRCVLSAGFARVRPEFETRGCVAERLAAEAKRARRRAWPVERSRLFHPRGGGRRRARRAGRALRPRRGIRAQGWRRALAPLS